MPDPYLNPNDRKTEMEEEMDEDEMEGLRGGWEDFVGEYEAGGSSTILSVDSAKDFAGPSKRKWTSDQEDVEPSKLKRPSATLKFDRDLVRQEKMRGLGVRATSSKRNDKMIGSRSLSPIHSHQDIEEVKDVGLGGKTTRAGQRTKDDGRSWTCTLCTFINALDCDRCGESHLHAYP